MKIRPSRATAFAVAAAVLSLAHSAPASATARALDRASVSAVAERGARTPVPLAATTEGAPSLESAATKAGETGRKVAMSMIALGFAIASIVLAFRRDFREAAGVFAIGIVAILLATPAGVNVLHDTVNTLFGG